MTEIFGYKVDDEIIDAAWRFLGSLLLLVSILLISYKKKLKMERSFLLASIRGFLQMLILASVLFYIFQVEGILPLILVLTVMVTFGAKTAADRIDHVANIFKVEFIALAISVFAIMFSMSILSVLPIDDPAFWIPIGGMVTGNSMNISYIALNRLVSDVKQKELEITAGLCLGGNPEQILTELDLIATALRVSITPNTNNLKTLGLVFIPGLMTGLLIGGVHPIAAALLQVMIFFLIIGGGLLAALIATKLVVKNLFDQETYRVL